MQFESYSITFLIRSLQVGGAERQLILNACELARRGHRVQIVVFYTASDFAEELAAAGVVVTSLEKRNRWDILSVVVKLRNLVRSFGTDVLYSFSPSSNLMATIVRPLLADVANVWGIRTTNMANAGHDWLGKLIAWLEPRLSKFADRVIVNSQAGFELMLHRGFPARRTLIIGNGVDLARFCRSTDDRHRLRREWGLSDSNVAVGIVGRLTAIKDHEFFLRIMAEVCARTPAVRGIVIGEGPLAETLKGVSTKLGLQGKVSWPGLRLDMPAVYSALDIVCSTSIAEGFSNVLAEAMACECICVTADVGDSAHIVDGFGVVVGERSVRAFAQKIEETAARKPSVDVTRMRSHIGALCSPGAVAVATERALIEAKERRCRR